MRAMLFGIALALTAVVLAAPAQATVTASLAGNAPLTPTANGWAYSGTCPVNVTFKATINATVTSTFKYGFNRNTGLSALTAAAASPSSSHTATDTLSFNASGTYWEQLFVTAIAPGQADVYTPDRSVANIKITCGTGGTSGGTIYETSTTVNGHSAVYQLYKLPAPTNVHVTTDPKECASHLPPIAFLLIPVCGEVLSQGGAEIVFSWEGTDQQPTADGFHVYNVAGHVLNPSLTTSAGGTSTVVFKKGPLYPVCFVLRAYKGTAESNDSQQVCLSGGVSTKTVVLNPTQAMTHQRVKQGHTGVFGGSDITEQDFHGNVIIGFTHNNGPGDPRGDRFANFVYRAGVLFDIASLHAKFVFKAVLHTHVTKSETGTREFTKVPNCISEIGVASNTWWNGGNIDSAFGDGLVPNSGMTDATLDVTTIVRGWSQGNSNQGFALRGSDEGLDAFSNDGCESHASPQLEVTYN